MAEKTGADNREDYPEENQENVQPGQKQQEQGLGGKIWGKITGAKEAITEKIENYEIKSTQNELQKNADNPEAFFEAPYEFLNQFLIYNGSDCWKRFDPQMSELKDAIRKKFKDELTPFFKKDATVDDATAYVQKREELKQEVAKQLKVLEGYFKIVGEMGRNKNGTMSYSKEVDEEKNRLCHEKTNEIRLALDLGPCPYIAPGSRGRGGRSSDDGWGPGDSDNPGTWD